MDFLVVNGAAVPLLKYEAYFLKADLKSASWALPVIFVSHFISYNKYPNFLLQKLPFLNLKIGTQSSIGYGVKTY